MSPAYSPVRDGQTTSTRVPSADGVECLLYDLDPGHTGPQLLLVHATGLPGRTYLPLARRLPDYHGFAVDLRGHGDATSPANGHYAWQGFTEDLLRLIDLLPPTTPRLGFGHSMGATVLLRAEAQRPGSFAALYCFEPIVPPPAVQAHLSRLPDDHEPPLSGVSRRRRNHFPDRETAFRNFASKPPLQSFDPDCLSAYVEWGFRDLPDGSVELQLPGSEEAEIYRMSAGHHTFSELAGIRCPVAVAHGALESGTASVWSPEIAAALPQGELVAFPELGHFGPLEDPARVTRSIGEFFARHT